jgi:transposase InsO family protein
MNVERSITTEDVVATLASLFRRRGELIFIGSDNGHEFIVKAVKRWLEALEVKIFHMELGSPWENAYSETFISRFSDELLKRGCSLIYLRRRCSSKTTAATTTTKGHTAHCATRPQLNTRWLLILTGRWRIQGSQMG